MLEKWLSKEIQVPYSKHFSIIQSEYRLFEYMTFNDETITITYLNNGYFP